MQHAMPDSSVAVQTLGVSHRAKDSLAIYLHTDAAAQMPLVREVCSRAWPLLVSSEAVVTTQINVVIVQPPLYMTT
jgi:hypothetical protein